MTSSQIEPKYKDKETKKTVILKFNSKTQKPHLNSHPLLHQNPDSPQKNSTCFLQRWFRTTDTLCDFQRKQRNIICRDVVYTFYIFFYVRYTYTFEISLI